MNIEPDIRILAEKKLTGNKITMSFARDKTYELWSRFTPRKHEISRAVGDELYAVHIYPDTDFFTTFNAEKEFESWAAVEVSDIDSVPEGLESLILPEGKYAVFHYKGKPSEAMETLQYIFGYWLIHSDYRFDNRPYFALMDKRYKGEDPESEEEFWVPVKSA